MSPAHWDANSGQRAEFFRQLQQLSTRIHATRHIDEIMLDVSTDICTLFGADRLTIYTVGDDSASLVSKVKTGLASFRQLRLPISAQSVAGYAALARRLLNLADVYDAAELQRYAAELRFQQGVDRRTGYRTREMLAIPILHSSDSGGDASEVSGVFQLINNLHGGPFSAVIVEGARYLCDTLAVAFAQRQQAAPRARTGFVGALGAGMLDRDRLDAAVRQARSAGRDVEDVLLDEFQVKLPIVGRALADHFAVPYLAWHPERRVPRELLTAIDRAGAGTRQWLPVERIDGTLYVVCVDPEHVKTSTDVGALFPHTRPVFCVTTRRDFGAMLDHYFGNASAAPAAPAVSAGGLTPAGEAQLIDTVAALVAGSGRQGLSDLHITTAPGATPGEIRFTVSGTMRLT